MRTLTNNIFERMTSLEEQVTHVKKGLRELLDEQDVQDLPSYDLLKSVYVEYLDSMPERSKSTEEKTEELYDPLYAPTQTRRRVNARARKKLLQEPTDPAPASPSPKPKQSEPSGNSTPSSTPSYMPDFSESLLEGMNTVRPQGQPRSKARPAQVIKVQDFETIYPVEIQGKQYLCHGKYLYNADTKIRTGSIEDGAFAIHGQNPIPFTSTELQLKQLPDTAYYTVGAGDGADAGAIFVRIGPESNIYHGVGALTEDGDIGLWE